MRNNLPKFLTGKLMALDQMGQRGIFQKTEGVLLPIAEFFIRSCIYSIIDIGYGAYGGFVRQFVQCPFFPLKCNRPWLFATKSSPSLPTVRPQFFAAAL